MAGSAGGPVRPRTLAVRFSRGDDELLIEHRQGGILAAGFLMLWLAGWTVGCVFLIGEVWTKPELFTLMFATPF